MACSCQIHRQRDEAGVGECIRASDSWDVLTSHAKASRFSVRWQNSPGQLALMPSSSRWDQERLNPEPSFYSVR